MPDQEINPTDSSAETPNSGGEGEPSFAPDHDSDAQHPRPGSDNPVVSREEQRAQFEATNKAYNRMIEQSTKHSEDEAQLSKELDNLKAQLNQGSPNPPTPQQMPPPPGQEQKNGIAVLATNLLKWSALLGLAYGLSRRSPRRNSIFKLGMAAALEGYQQGNNEARDKSLALWEKNRQFIQDQNREQHQQYEDTLKENHTTWGQKMDILRQQSSLWQNKRAEDAATRGDVKEFMKMQQDQIRMEHAHEREMRQDRAEWYKLLGLNGVDGADYAEWVKNRGGGDIRKAIQDGDEDKINAIESANPRHVMLEERDAAKDKKKEDEETRKEDRAFELHKKEKLYDMQLQQSGGAPDDPNTPLGDDKAKKWRDLILGSGTD